VYEREGTVSRPDVAGWVPRGPVTADGWDFSGLGPVAGEGKPRAISPQADCSRRNPPLNSGSTMSGTPNLDAVARIVSITCSLGRP
jgi:hypothetical protein